MDTRFLSQNIHRNDPGKFQALDVHLYQLKQFKYVHNPELLQQLPIGVPGIYTLTGGILTGKTTLLKRWMAKLLADGIPAETITFLSGELITDNEDLIHLLQTQLKNKSFNNTHYVFIDDVTLVRHWDQAIKFVSETGLLDHTMLMLVSSDKSIEKYLQTVFSQNQIKINTFKLYPLTFHESISLQHPYFQITEIDLFEEFNHYLLHGGYLIAMNDVASHGKILDETFKSFSASLSKQVLSYGKQAHFLHEILTAIINHYCMPITWNGLAQELSINHPKTIGDYMTLLESLDAVFIQSALLEKTLTAAPKKARKLMFTDPFIFHAISAWLHKPNENVLGTERRSSHDSSELCSRLVKACVITHYWRHYPTYYIKDEGEIDLAYLYEQRFWPVVIAWTNPLRAKDLKQILKYPNSKILTKALRSGIIEHIRTEPLPQMLWKLGKTHVK